MADINEVIALSGKISAERESLGPFMDRFIALMLMEDELRTLIGQPAETPQPPRERPIKGGHNHGFVTERLMEILPTDRPMRVNSLMKIIGCSSAALHAHLAELKRDGKILHVGYGEWQKATA